MVQLLAARPWWRRAEAGTLFTDIARRDGGKVGGNGLFTLGPWVGGPKAFARVVPGSRLHHDDLPCPALYRRCGCATITAGARAAKARREPRSAPSDARLLCGRRSQRRLEASLAFYTFEGILICESKIKSFASG